MLPGLLAAQSFELRRYPTIIDHGTAVLDTSATPTTTILHGSVQPGTGTTDVINRDGAEVVQTIWVAPGADVRHNDLIALNGIEYFVNGAPEAWRTGVLDHDVIQLSRWIG